MSTPSDNGYISKYLIHWMGKDGDDCGAEILSTIASTLRLLLSYNQIHVFDWHHEIKEKMVCFTDVPLQHSAKHCKRYGRFAIAFHKLKLMNVGAQPVFYATHACKKDMDTIFRFFLKEALKPSLPVDVFRALHRHFYFIQRLSKGRADSRLAYYYEREWRLGEQTLVPEENLKRPNARYWCLKEGYPPYTGKLFSEGGKDYFVFEPEFVAFLICPRSRESEINNPHCFHIKAFENIIETKGDNW